MRTLDIIEIDMVAGGTRASIGAHLLSSSIHHAKPHKKVHYTKAKAHHQHHHAAMHKAVALQTATEFDAPMEEAEDGEGGEGDGGAGSNANPATSASASGTTVTYTAADGSTEEVTGTHPNRDNNPLDIRSGSFADDHGSLGNDRGFAIFSIPQAGLDAAVANINRINDNNDGTATLSQIISTWSPPSENPTSKMITTNSGLTPSDQRGSLTSAQQNAFVIAYGRREGWHGN